MEIWEYRELAEERSPYLLGLQECPFCGAELAILHQKSNQERDLCPAHDGWDVYRRRRGLPLDFAGMPGAPPSGRLSA